MAANSILKRPAIGVGVFVLNAQNSFVLGKRLGSFGAGTWGLPGGHLEFGETFEDCASREVCEETGLEVRDLQFLTATNDPMGSERHYVTIFMVCRLASEKAMPQVLEPDKCQAWEWVGWDTMTAWAKQTQDERHGEGGMKLADPEPSHPLFMPLLDLLRQRPDVSLPRTT